MSQVSAHAAPTSVKRHPIAAVIWGIVGGLGVSLFLMGRAEIPVGKWTAPIIIIVIMIALNLAWAYFGPAKRAKGQPPSAASPEPEPVTEPVTEPEPEQAFGAPDDGGESEGDTTES